MQIQVSRQLPGACSNIKQRQLTAFQVGGAALAGRHDHLPALARYEARQAWKSENKNILRKVLWKVLGPQGKIFYFFLRMMFWKVFGRF